MINSLFRFIDAKKRTANDNIVICTNCIFMKATKNVCKLFSNEHKVPDIICNNKDSEYYYSILNMKPNGIMDKKVLHSGCNYGVKKDE